MLNQSELFPRTSAYKQPFRISLRQPKTVFAQLTSKLISVDDRHSDNKSCSDVCTDTKFNSLLRIVK